MHCPADYTPFPWMLHAEQEHGISEMPGLNTEPHIAAYLASVGMAPAPRGDETPWCSAFVNWCMEQVGVLGTGRANARSWLNWIHANPCSLAKPPWGAVVVLWRVRRSSWQGHVGFYVGTEGNNVLLLGGNQGNRVSIRSYTEDRILGYRWPRSYPIPAR